MNRKIKRFLRIFRYRLNGRKARYAYYIKPKKLDNDIVYVKGNNIKKREVQKKDAEELVIDNVILPQHHDVKKITSKSAELGIFVVSIFIFSFLVWGGLAPIDSASIASGKVVLDFNKKTIQHLEGGIIEEILVKEGQRVEHGQPLVHLKDIQSISKNKMLIMQLATSKAIKTRLLAERDMAEELDFDIIFELYQDDDLSAEQIDNVVSTQEQFFHSRIEAKKGRIAILNKKVNQLEDEIDGLEHQQKAINETSKVLAKQKKTTIELVRGEISPLNDLLEIEKQLADNEGRKGELKSQISKINRMISETKLEIINLESEGLNEIQAELQDIEIKIAGLTEQLTSTKDILKRTVIKSPISGVVMDMKYHTIGAVIAPGGDIMFVVPGDDELIIEARVDPKDIDNVKGSKTAKVQLTAYKAKRVPKLTGHILSISGDILLDEATGEQYFLARIKISDEELKKLRSNIELYPGMPAQVFIISGSRTLFSYIFAPIAESAYRAFREE